MRRHTRLLLLSLGVIVGCASRGAERRAHEVTELPGQPGVAPRRMTHDVARWVLLPERTSKAADIDPLDATEHVIEHGVRLLVHPNGALEQALEAFPIVPVQPLELPERLGGGYLFSAVGSHTTWLWKAATWTGPLEALARLDPEASSIVAGFDRLYVASKKTHQLRAISAQSGQPAPLGALPEAPSYGGLGFLDAWTAVASLDVRGLLVTFDAGASWHPLGLAPEEALDPVRVGSGLSFNTAAGRMVLGPDGTIRRADSRETPDLVDELPRWFARVEPEDSPARVESAPARSGLPGEHLLRQAVLRGVPGDPGPSAAVVWADGQLALVDLADGTVKRTLPSLPAAHAECQGIALGKGFGFVCSESSATTIYRYVGGLEVEPVLTLSGRRQVLVAGAGALVIHGGCREAPSARSNGRYCTVDQRGRVEELTVARPTGRERVSVLSDSRRAILLPPEPGNEGSLTVVGQGRDQHLALDLTGVEPGLARLLRSGLWLDGLQSVSSVGGETLRTWVADAGPLVGVSVDLHGKVSTARPKESIERAVVSGSTAMLLTSGDLGQLSTDFGFDWRDVRLPRGLSEQPRLRGDAPVWRGCGLLGCAFEEWLRIGWGDDPPPAPEQPVPPVVVHSPKGISRWALSCLPTGRIGGQMLAASAVASGQQATAGSGQYADSAWLSFFGRSPPNKPRSSLGFDYLLSQSSPTLHAYTLGPRTTSWEGTSQWLLRIVNRYSAGSVWSTRLSRAAWKDVASAAELFGQDPTTTARWQLDVDDASERAVLMLRVRGRLSVYLLEAERGPIAVVNPDDIDMERLAGFAVVGGSWYFAGVSSQQLVLYRVEAERAEAVAKYPEFARDGGVTTELVSDEGGRGMALWAKSSSSGWYVFPLHPATLEAMDALRVPYDALRTIPPRCDAEASGYEVVSTVPLTDTTASRSNMLAEIEGQGELAVRGMSVKALVDAHGVCVRSVAAEVDVMDTKNLAHVAWRHSETPIQLTVTDTTNQVQADLLCRR